MPENENKVRRRFNIIDLFIILAVVAVIVGVALRFNLADKIGVKSNRDTVTVSFIITDIKESSADALVIGDTFFIDANKIELGELISKKPTYAEAFIENDDGVLVKTANENKYDVRGEIRATGRIKDDGFMLGGTQFIAANKILYVYSQHIMVTMTITGIYPE